MNKKLVALFSALTLSLTAFLGGCSCSGATTLSFSNAFAGGDTISGAYAEKLVYDVEYKPDYNDALKKNADLDGVMSFEFTNGKYVSEFKGSLTAAVLDGLTSDIKDKLSETDSNAYSLHTEFTLDASVTITDKTYDHTDYIYSTVYFAPAGLSFAPLYSKTESEYFIISANKDSAAVLLVKTVYEVFYTQKEYRAVQTAKTFDADETAPSLDDVESIEKTVKYDYRSVIDNAQLLFAVRGVSLAEKASAVIPATSLNYDRATSLRFTNAGTSEKRINVKYNGADISETVKYNALNFRVDSTNTAGTAQYISVQADKTENLPHRALPIEYVKGLITYGNFSCMGALVFTLAEVEIINS
ncbi:MAG: hypothetical protein IJU83_00530 [Clostridia bacterium]|nr:hypothetical protein [Clostridia bacterium]